MIRGEGTVVIKGVAPQDVYDFVLDPSQYSKADLKIQWVTKLADTPEGMIAREDGKFLGLFPGSVVTRYVLDEPTSIDVTLVHGFPKAMHAWFEIEAADGGTKMRHVEEMDLGHGPLGLALETIARAWFPASVGKEVSEIKRLMEAGERGMGIAGGEKQR